MRHRTGIVRDRRFLDHWMGSHHVESPFRLEALYSMLEEDSTVPLVDIKPRPASEEELMFVHDLEYVRSISHTAGREHVVLDPDTSTSPLSYETARLAAGGLLKAAEAIMGGEVRNAFALVRPPGHHAESFMARGFCIFNNIAVAAEYLLRRYGLKRILIVDWDIHHGNGTQHAFYDRRDVLYFSSHQYPHYPGTGFWDETGEGEGRGYTINIPLLAGKGDRDFLHIYRNILRPIASQFEPEFVLVSAGFDLGSGDPLGGMDVSENGFGALAAEVMSQAEEYSEGRLLLTLEGGYNLKALRGGVRNVLLRLSGEGTTSEVEPQLSPQMEIELRPALDHLRQFWKVP